MSAATGALTEEHELLGAQFVESDVSEAPVVGSYAAEPASSYADEGALLFDLSGHVYDLVGGPCAQALAEACFAGRALVPGQCGFEACLTGEGNLLSVSLLLRAGDAEYVLLDPSARGVSVHAWLGFLANLEQDGTRPFDGSTVEEASAMLVPLLLVGRDAEKVLSDYVSAPEALPAAGEVASIHLDRIPVVAACLPQETAACKGYVLLVPPVRARVLWRSLLSFGEVMPAGEGTLRVLAQRCLPWGTLLASTDNAVRPSRDELLGWGVLREDDTYVGARGLRQAEQNLEGGAS